MAKVKAQIEVQPFDAAEFLDSNEAIAAYLNAAMDERDTDVFLRALSNVVCAKGVATIAERAGVGRESLYKTLAPGSRPRYETIHKLLEALDVRLRANAA